MTTFDDAARKAAEEFVDTYEKMTLSLVSDLKRIGIMPANVNIDLKQIGADDDNEKIAKKITKHYADLAETFGLLVEVVKMQNAQRIHRESFMKFQDHVDANKHKTGIAVNARLAELFANPRIAALLAEKKG